MADLIEEQVWFFIVFRFSLFIDFIYDRNLMILSVVQVDLVVVVDFHMLIMAVHVNRQIYSIDPYFSCLADFHFQILRYIYK